jgi:1,4-dihydroxy-2-naphthoate octaprenyltransferase/chlorophyll synthase
MHRDNFLGRWIYALKPASWPKLLVPMFLGQALGVAVAAGDPRPVGLLFGGLFTLFDLVFIVLLNDWLDRDVDALKRHMFPGAGSPKTIPDGILKPSHVLAGGLTACALAVGLAAAVSARVGPGLLLASVACLTLFAAYSAPPLRLNYRGGGELLEMVGVGLALPWLNIYASSGVVISPELWALAGFMILSLASAIASGLSDEQSDRAGGKRTVATWLGNASARRIVELLVVLGAMAWLVTAWVMPRVVHPSAALPSAAVVLWRWVPLRRASGHAVTNAFAAQSRYKRELHRAIWGGGLVFGFVAAGRALFAPA